MRDRGPQLLEIRICQYDERMRRAGIKPRIAAPCL